MDNGHVNTVWAVCCEQDFFSSAHELLSACVMAVFFFFFNVFCASLYLYYISLVVSAASIDGCLCLSGSLPLLSCILVLILCFEANKYDDDDDQRRASRASPVQILVRHAPQCLNCSAAPEQGLQSPAW